jgi:threonine dehydrogenase-like Zn-dependent dehydrogenase
MNAVCWYGKHDVRVTQVDPPAILNRRDAIVKVRATSICGSDLHIYNGFVPRMKKGDILGHEFIGEVVEAGPEVRNLQIGDLVVVPASISCGNCFFCQNELWSLCDNSNPNAGMAEEMFGYSESGMFGSSHLYGGYAGGQAEFARVPFADVGPVKVSPELKEEQLVLLCDVLPTAWRAAEECNIEEGDIVAVWGCGAVGQLAIQAAILLGAAKVIAIDGEPARLKMAESQGAISVRSDAEITPQLRELTGGRGPDACIDAVGLEAHRRLHATRYDQSKKEQDYSPDNPHVLRQAIHACRKGGTIFVAGDYAGVFNKFPFGAVFAKGLTLKTGQTPARKHIGPLLEKIRGGQFDPSFVFTHHLPLTDAVNGYGLFNEMEDGCIKVLLKPG